MSIAVVKYGLFDPVKNAKNYIIDSLKEALIVTDPEYQFLFLNPMAETLVSSTKNVMALKPDGYLLKNMEPQSLHDAIDRFFAERAEQEN